MSDLTEREIEQARQYLICQTRGHTPSNRKTASIPPQEVCGYCGTYFRTVVEKTVQEGFGKPSPRAIAAAKARRD